MASAITDRFTGAFNSANPNVAKVTAGRTAGALSLSCDNLAGWPTATAVHFSTYKIDTTGAVISGSQIDWKGLVAGNTVGTMTRKAGAADAGNAIGDIVEMNPTGSWEQDLMDGLTAQHTQAGAHHGLTTDTLATSSNATVGGTLGVTGVATHSGASVLTGDISGAGYSIRTIANPYKFLVYRNGASNSGSSVFALTPFDTKVYDTGSNVDVVTNVGRFTAPVAGFYSFSFTVTCVSNGTNQQLAAALYKNGAIALRGSVSNVALTATTSAVSGSSVLQLAANDYVEVWNAGTPLQLLTSGASTTYFSGFLVSAA